MILDLLLSDVFIGLTRSSRPHFASLFVNAGAHIQHHYLFNSPAYGGAGRNPSWYIQKDADPLLDVYKLYDSILSQICGAFPGARLLLATGLHQDPHPEVTYYWRLVDHRRYLRKLGIAFKSVEALMSRDFRVNCENVADAVAATDLLVSAKDMLGQRLFEVDNRGESLFVMLTYASDIGQDFSYRTCRGEEFGLRDEVAFVALKNGRHNGKGYFLDTAVLKSKDKECFSLSELPRRIATALGGLGL